MASDNKLKKNLTLFDVYAVSTGAMFSSGFFLLPGIAASYTGDSVYLAYLLAGFLIIPAMLCMAELSTAMPKAGGTYYFLDRALGPLFGTIGGLGSWVAVVFKSAFALVGMGAYLSLYLDVPILVLAVILRRISWVAIPLATCSATVVVMLGLLGALDWRMTVISSNFVAVLLIITLAITIHLIVRYRELHSINPDEDEHARVLNTVRLARIWATVFTRPGFMCAARSPRWVRTARKRKCATNIGPSWPICCPAPGSIMIRPSSADMDRLASSTTSTSTIWMPTDGRLW